MGYTLSELKPDKIPKLTDRMETADQWEPKRDRIMEEWLKLLGSAPSPELWPQAGENVPFDVLAEIREHDHRRLDIRYRTRDCDTIRAYLLIPDSSPARGDKYPAVLALHPTALEGREDVAAPEGRDNRRYGVELVSRGYVVLAPDAITFGSRVYPGAEPFQTAPFYKRYPGWTAVGKMLADHMLSLNLLCGLSLVDSKRIGAIGHSLGGYNAWFLAGLDRRVRAVVSSCGFSMFTGDPDPNRWGQREWFSHFPSLTEWLHADRIPFEWHEIAALAAPTPMFMWSGTGDRIFPNWQAIAAGMADLDSLYRLLSHDGAFEFWMGPSGHDFPSRTRELAYTFLDRWLA